MKNLGIVAIAIGAICTTACNKDKPADVSTTQTTSSDIDLGTRPAAAQATEPQKDDYRATVRREQLILRSRLDDEMMSIDRQLNVLRRAPERDQKAIDDLVTQRQTLEADANVVDRSDERGWDELKAVVEHDLEGQPQM